MKVKVVPQTLLGKFNVARKLSSHSGFKIFNPSRRYFRDAHQFIAARNDPKHKSKKPFTQGVFRLWIYREKIWIEFYPFYEDNDHKKFLEKELEIKIHYWSHHPAMRRFDPPHNMVCAAEHYEFDLLTPPIRLP